VKIPNKNLPTIHVMLTHGWNRISYNILRDLGKRGLKVVLGTDEHSGMSVFSRYKFARFCHPVFDLDEEGFIVGVLGAAAKYRPLVYIPSDEEIFIAARFKKEFAKLNVKVPVAGFEVLDRLHKKQRAIRLAGSLGIPTRFPLQIAG